MAPVFGSAVAPFLYSLFSRIFVIVLVLSALSANYCVSAAIKYDRHTLFHIRDLIMEDYGNWTWYKPIFSPVFECSLTSPEYLLLSKGRGRRKKRGSRAGVQTRLRRYRTSSFTLSGSGLEQVERFLRQVPISASGHGAVVVMPPPYEVHYSRAFPTRQAQIPGIRERVLRPVSLYGERNGAKPIAHMPQSAGVNVNLIRVALLNARSIANKAFILNDVFIKERLDFMCLTETWQRESDYVHLNELRPPGCSVFGTARKIGRGGGLAIVHRDCFSCRQLSQDSFSSFEHQMTKDLEDLEP